jgi:hypothetical protein
MSISPDASPEKLSVGSKAFMAEPMDQSDISPFIVRCVEISKIIPVIEISSGGEETARDIAIISSKTPLSDGRNKAPVPVKRLFTGPALRGAIDADPECEKAGITQNLDLLIPFKDPALNRKMAVAMVKAELDNDLASLPTRKQEEKTPQPKKQI